MKNPGSAGLTSDRLGDAPRWVASTEEKSDESMEWMQRIPVTRRGKGKKIPSGGVVNKINYLIVVDKGPSRGSRKSNPLSFSEGGCGLGGLGTCRTCAGFLGRYP